MVETEGGKVCGEDGFDDSNIYCAEDVVAKERLVEGRDVVGEEGGAVPVEKSSRAEGAEG